MKRLLPALLLLLACGHRQEPAHIRKTGGTRRAAVAVPPAPAAEARAFDSGSARWNAYAQRVALRPLEERTRQVLADSVFTIGGHRVECHDTDTDTWLKIDGRVIRLAGKVTLNGVTDRSPDSVDFANNWLWARLYRHGGKELLLLALGSEPCTGLGCSVQEFLLYDVSTRALSFFGSFRGDDHPLVLLYKNRPAFVAEDFSGDPQGSTAMTFRQHLYARAANGRFRPVTDAQGRSYERVVVE
ncbi:MAG: hypothetical protein EOO12_16150, partial [Chitinophagaceae bacterium]